MWHQSRLLTLNHTDTIQKCQRRNLAASCNSVLNSTSQVAAYTTINTNWLLEFVVGFKHTIGSNHITVKCR